MEKILEKSGKSQGILSVRKSGNPAVEWPDLLIIINVVDLQSCELLSRPSNGSRTPGVGGKKYEIFCGHIRWSYFIARFTIPEGHVPGPLMLRIVLCVSLVFLPFPRWRQIDST